MSCCERFQIFVTKKQKKTARMGEHSSICDLFTIALLCSQLNSFVDQNNTRDQNFAPSFRNDSHISSRNEHRTTTPHFKMTVIYDFETRQGLLLISKRQSFVISKGSSYSFERIDIYRDASLYLSNMRFWSKSQGVRNNFFASNWKQSMTKMHVRHYCRTCCVISYYEKFKKFSLKTHFAFLSFSFFLNTNQQIAKPPPATTTTASRIHSHVRFLPFSSLLPG